MKTITIKVQGKPARFRCEVVSDYHTLVKNSICFYIYNNYYNQKWRLELSYSTMLFKNGLQFRQLLYLSRWSSTIRKTYP
jgi:hypothetical protein